MTTSSRLHAVAIETTPHLDRGVVAFVVLLLAAATVAVLVRRVPVPYVSVLAVAGVVLGAVAGGSAPRVTSSLILFIVLPGLLFESSFALSWTLVRRDAGVIVSLATVGVAVTMAVIALLGHAALGLAVPVAILLGAAVAPTDPVAVVSLFRRLGAPARLTTVVEAESLLNDGTGVVAFTLALTAATGEALGVGSAVLDFLRLAGGGILLGIAVGVVLARLTRRIDDSQVELTYTAIGAYGTYVGAELLHVSGILAVVACALVMGNDARRHGMSATTLRAVDTVWSYVAFLLNSAVFLLIGLSISPRSLWEQRGAIVAAFCIVLLARAVAVYLLLAPLRLLRGAPSWAWQHIVVWGGIRGAVAIALVLSLAEQTGNGFDTVRVLVDGVVLLGIVLQGVTIGPLTSRLLGAHTSTAVEAQHND